jgi:hypothetical protein
MSWFYRFFQKSDNEQVVTLTAPAIQLTGAATITGAFAVTGAQTFTGNQTVTGTARVVSYLYLGTGTKALVTGTAGIDPINNGIAGSFDKGSIFMGGTANLYYKTDYASTSWASIDAYD